MKILPVLCTQILDLQYFLKLHISFLLSSFTFLSVESSQPFFFPLCDTSQQDRNTHCSFQVDCHHCIYQIQHSRATTWLPRMIISSSTPQCSGRNHDAPALFLVVGYLCWQCIYHIPLRGKQKTSVLLHFSD